VRQSRIIVAAFACALFLRLWVPAGWMPAASGGAFAIAPCVASVPAQLAKVAHHHSGTHEDPAHKAQHQGDCAFAPLGAGFATSASSPQLPAPIRANGIRHRHVMTPSAPTGPPALPPPSTGPPPLV
jgi:hypothetical protein